MTKFRCVDRDRYLRDLFQEKKPILGICLGRQIIFDFIELDGAGCLGPVTGGVKRFRVGREENEKPVKVPDMG